jgi:hypothetical protein
MSDTQMDLAGAAGCGGSVVGNGMGEESQLRSFQLLPGWHTIRLPSHLLREVKPSGRG